MLVMTKRGLYDSVEFWFHGIGKEFIVDVL